MKRSFAVRSAGVFAALALVSCFGDSTGPAQRRPAGVAFRPVFDVRASAVVDFERVRVTLARVATEGQLALDTTIDFPAGADSVRLPLTVQLAPGATSEPFDLMLEMLNAAGDVVFRGGPTRVTVTTGILSGAAPDVPMTYVGVGSDAAGVRFRAPVPSLVYFDSAAVFVAEAYDVEGTAIAGTPVVYQVDPADSAKARVPDPSVGRVVGRPVRGAAAVVARLLTGQTARTSLLVQPLPTALAVTGGGAQSGTVHATLPQPIAVRVTAADGLGVQGVVVTFAVASGGGSLSATADTTDASGYAGVSWTLGTAAVSQSITATAGTLPSASVSATALAGTANRLAFQTQPASTGANLIVAPPVRVAAQDSFGNTVATFTGAVTLTFGTNPGGAALGGSCCRRGRRGHRDLQHAHRQHRWYRVHARRVRAGLTPATSALFDVTGGVATKLGFLTQPSTAGAGAAIAPAVRVAVQDVNGTTVPSAVNRVTVALGANPATDSLSGTLTVSAVNGVATFADLTMHQLATGVTLAASSSDLTGATSAPFAIATGTAATLSLVSGNGQGAAPGLPLALPVVVRVADAFGNGVSGRTVAFAVATGGGSVGTPSAATDATGSASTTWTLGATPGAQTMTATATGLAGSPLTIGATAIAVASVTVSPNTTLVNVGQPVQFTATMRDALGNILSGRAVTWQSGNTAVATVSNTGLATVLRAGQAVITATSEGVSGTATLTASDAPVSTAQSVVTVSSPAVLEGGTVTDHPPDQGCQREQPHGRRAPRLLRGGWRHQYRDDRLRDRPRRRHVLGPVHRRHGGYAAHREREHRPDSRDLDLADDPGVRADDDQRAGLGRLRSRLHGRGRGDLLWRRQQLRTARQRRHGRDRRADARVL